MIYRIILLLFFCSIYVSSTEIEDSLDYEHRVAWGDDVYEEGAYPYYLSLGLIHGMNLTRFLHFCSGSLIGKRIMITAAHCLDDIVNVRLFDVLPNYRNTKFVQSNDLTFKISKYVLHPDYNNANDQFFKNDIAVSLLDKEDPRPNATIKLPNKYLAPNTKVKMMGFGRIEFDQKPDRLREATVFIRSDYECAKLASLCGRIFYIAGNNICVSNERGSAGCPGDSGGPLVWEDPENNESYLIGVTSAVRLPCYLGKYTIYVNVYYHLNFINDAINLLTNDA